MAGTPSTRRPFGASLPVVAQELGAAIASPGQRFGAFLIDLAVIVLAGTVTALSTGAVLLGLIVAVELVIVIWAWEARRGSSFGKSVLGLRTLRIDQRLPLGPGRAFTKFSVLGLGGLAAVVGAFLVEASTAFDSTPARQGWHDKASRSITVVARGRAPRTAHENDLVTRASFSPEPPTTPPPAPVPAVLPDFSDSTPPPQPAPVGAPPLATIPDTPTLTPPPPYSTPSAPPVAAPPPGPATWNGRPPDPTAPPAGPGIPVAGPPTTAPPHAPVAPPAALGPSDQLSIVLENGARSVLPLPGRTVLGRRPSTLAPGDNTLPTPPGFQTISRSHLLIEADATGTWVTDLASANGSWLMVNGAPRRLAANARTPVAPTARVRTGDLTFTLIRSPQQENPGVR